MKKDEIIKEIQYISEQIINAYHPIKIILFGSACKEEYDDLNDLDFLIIKENVPDIGIERMRELDDLVDRNMAADMLVYRPDEIEHRIKIGDPFIKSILSEGRVLYG